MTLTYTRLDWKRIPEIAADRDATAKMYRHLRADRPDMARLLWRRMKNAQKASIAMITGNLFMGRDTFSTDLLPNFTAT